MESVLGGMLDRFKEGRQEGERFGGWSARSALERNQGRSEHRGSPLIMLFPFNLESYVSPAQSVEGRHPSPSSQPAWAEPSAEVNAQLEKQSCQRGSVGP